MQPLILRISEEEKARRFRDLVNRHKGVDFSNYTELAALIDYQSNNLYKVMKDKDPALPPDSLIYRVCELFKYQPGFIFGRDEKLRSYDSTDISKSELKQAVLDMLSKQKDLTESYQSLLSQVSK